MQILSIFYGKEKANKFQELFTDHLAIAANLVDFAINDDNEALEKANEEWFMNADDIATFLSGINPYWSKQEWQRMLHDHLETTLNEAVFRLQGKFADDIANYEKIEDMALMMADYMANGIIRQFGI